MDMSPVQKEGASRSVKRGTTVNGGYISDAPGAL